MAKTKEQKRREALARQQAAPTEQRPIIVLDDIMYYPFATHHFKCNAAALDFVQDNPRLEVLCLDYWLIGETTQPFVDWLLSKIADGAKVRIGLIALTTGDWVAEKSLHEQLDPHYKVVSARSYELYREGIITKL
jgi:hypothetical protein